MEEEVWQWRAVPLRSPPTGVHFGKPCPDPRASPATTPGMTRPKSCPPASPRSTTSVTRLAKYWRYVLCLLARNTCYTACSACDATRAILRAILAMQHVLYCDACYICDATGGRKGRTEVPTKTCPRTKRDLTLSVCGSVQVLMRHDGYKDEGEEGLHPDEGP